MKRAGALAAIVLLTVVPLARADGDPASDVLLAQASTTPMRRRSRAP